MLWFVPRLNSIAFINTIKWHTITNIYAMCFEVRTEFITLQTTVLAICIICINVKHLCSFPRSVLCVSYDS